jgi:hypothetical protein
MDDTTIKPEEEITPAEEMTPEEKEKMAEEKHEEEIQVSSDVTEEPTPAV